MIKFSCKQLGSISRNSAIYLFVFFLFCGSNALAEEWLYTVQPGDNLWKLSKQHLTSIRYWKKLQLLNNIQDPLNIPPGSTMRIPIAWLKSGPSVGQIIAITGEAQIFEHRTGQRKNAQLDMILWDNDTIQTNAGGNATLQFVDGSRILLQENSKLRLEKLVGYGTTGLAKTKARLEKGRSENKVTPKSGPKSRFEISTPSAIAAVRGTEYRLSAEKNGESKAEILKGEVGINSVGASEVVPQGFGTIAYSDHKPLPPVKLLDPPNLTGLPSKIARVPFPLTIEALKGAVQYRLQISKSEAFDGLIFDTTFPSAKIWGPDLVDGNYFLRIRGIDARGLEGLDSIHPFAMDAHPLPPMQVTPVTDAFVLEPNPTFQWSEPMDDASYRFQLALDERFEQVLIDKSRYRDTSLTLASELTPGVYFWRVATTDRKGKVGPFSDSQPFRRSPSSPDIADSKLDSEEMVFSWRKSDDGQKYRCQVARDSEFSKIVADEVVTESRFSFASFDYGSYYIRIAVIDIDGYQGPFSPYQKTEIPPPFWLAWLLPVSLLLILAL